jgi:methylthioribose-1-phosphate isomerase
MSFDTLRWQPPAALEILDQRALPLRETYLPLESAADTAAAIRDLAVRGAPAIGCAAGFGIAVEAHRLRDHAAPEFAAALEAGFAILGASRPTAVNLFWALRRMRAAWEVVAQAGVDAIVAALAREAQAIFVEDIEANRRMGAHGAALVPDGARILTHCNAGALATAGHGTALGVIRSAVTAGRRVQVYADETRPVLQGARLTAWELHRDGIPVTLLPDVAAASLLARGLVDLVIVGADRIAANGDVANKIGTYPLAVLARRHGVPFYVAAPLTTFDFSLATGAEIPIEERDAAEVRGYGAEVWAPEVPVFNPAFDVTPAELVTAIVTERGVVRGPSTHSLAMLNRPAQ